MQYVVQQVCLHMHAPRDSHLTLAKRILRYIRGTISLGLTLSVSPCMDLAAYSDADWAGCPDTCRSTSDYCVYLGPSLVLWSSEWQPTVSRSSPEAEYREMANVVAECTWLRLHFRSCTTMSPRPRLSIVTTSLWCTFPPTPFIIAGRSTSSLISTLCANR